MEEDVGTLYKSEVLVKGSGVIQNAPPFTNSFCLRVCITTHKTKI